MLETISRYASARLSGTDRSDGLRERHARAFVALAEEAAPHLEELDPRPWRDRLEADDANLRAALDWALESGDVALVHAGVGDLWRYWQLTGRLSEGREWTQAALAMPGADEPTVERIRVLAADASIAYWQGDLEAARRGYDEQLALAERLHVLAEQADAWYSLIHVTNYGGDLGSGARAEAAAMQAFRELGDDLGLEKVEIAAAASLVPAAYGDPERMLPELEARLDRAERLTSRWAVFSCKGIRSGVLLLHGDIRGAVRLAAETMRLGCETGHEGDVVMMLPPIVLAALGSERQETAAVALGAFRAAQDRYGMLTPTPFQAWRAGDPSEDLRAALGDERYVAAFERGALLPVVEIVDFIELSMLES